MMAKAKRNLEPEKAGIRSGERDQCSKCHAGKPGPCHTMGCPWPVARRLANREN